MKNTKIATCTYCGTRAALVLTGDTQHELACASCGAPLHDMKSLKAESKPKPLKPHKQKLPKPQKKQKKKKSLGQRFLGEAFDLIEDIFD
ncbi:hypothetical protein [Tropicibacter naphthalenivorans]|uniref:Uncharacterized protein n=1 Tax=Tropicibacter naphthalenivorans TaxID=441103 RepID=A0A0N7LYU5_9RHOB|nr:hypothetical protein [Tropicibacter naphthalenivorans]CUH75841.1 hypothetical protein TRN7648_00649 [Tropicibacter naphthalenivorans]SMC41896.1 hypothetical protein SAMN04488093_101236 [Tropicibacter naphthalenivorans]